MQKTKYFFFIPIVILVLFLGFNSFYLLDNAEAGVIERLGKLHKVENSAGLNFMIPFIDRVHIVNTNQIYSLQYGYRSMVNPTTTSPAEYRSVSEEAIVLSRGSYLIDVGAVIQYRITDPAAYIYEVDDVEGTVRLAFESVLRSNLQNQDLDDALINKDSIADELRPDLVHKLNEYNVGISITDVRLTDVLLPAEVQPAYDDVNIAQNEQAGLRSRAARYENEMLPKARAEAYEMVQDAEAYRAERLAHARGEVENFNQVYERYVMAEDITRTRLYIETMETILSTVNEKYIIDLDGQDTLKFLPLQTGGDR